MIKNPWVVSVLQLWEWLCTDFLRHFQIVELKGALYHSLLSSAAGWGSARAVWLPWGAAGACGPFAAGRRVWRASGVKEMSFLCESYLLGLLMG